MKTLIIYDSNFGNTKKIAETIALELKTKAHYVLDAEKIKPEEYEVIIVGSPINGWQPTQRIKDYLNSLKENSLQNLKATSFDTRVNVFFHGDAAKKIAKQLKNAGAEIYTEPEVFYVEDKDGPLLINEVKRAIAWAKKLRKNYG